MPPPVYVTLKEAEEIRRRTGKPVDPNSIVPSERQQLFAVRMGLLDDLPAPVRLAIKKAAWDPMLNFATKHPDGSVTTEEVDFQELAVKLLDKGMPVDQVVKTIREIDAKTTAVERKAGTVPPEGRAT